MNFKQALMSSAMSMISGMALPQVGRKAPGDTGESSVIPMVTSTASGRPQQNAWSTTTAINAGLKSSIWVYACCNKLASAVASVTWRVEKRVPETDTEEEYWEPIPSHPAAQLIANPNQYLAGQDMMEMLEYHCDLGGNELWHKILYNGYPIDLFPIMPDPNIIQPIPNAFTWLEGYKYTISGYAPRILKPEEVCHFMYTDPGNPYWGLSPIQAAGATIDSDVEAVRWNKVSMANRTVLDNVVIFKAPLNDEQWKEAREHLWEMHSGGDNAHLPGVLGGDAQFVQLGRSPVEMDFIETRKLHRAEICAVYQVPPILIGDFDRATFNNYGAAKQSFWEDTIMPRLDNIRAALNHGIMRHWDVEGYKRGGTANLRLNYDSAKIKQMLDNFANQVKIAVSLSEMGVPFDQINERLNLGFGPIPGGDQPRPVKPVAGAASYNPDGAPEWIHPFLR